MAEIDQYVVAVTTTGVAGSASGNGDTDDILHGEIEDIFLDYHASAPGTTDVTISFKDRGGNVLVVSNNATDGLYHPRAKPVDNANAAITNAHGKFVAHQKLNVAVAQADALTACVTAYIRVRRP